MSVGGQPRQGQKQQQQAAAAQARDVVMQVNERCQRNRWRPSFAVEGPPLGPFWCTVTVAGCAEMAGVAVRGGEAATKKAAKKLAVVAWMEAADACGV